MNQGKSTKKNLPLGLQALHMRERWPDFRVVEGGAEIIIWRGTLRPSPMSACYLVEIRYGRTGFPSVDVLSPALELFPGETRQPHTYAKRNLCLHYPEYKEWTRAHWIALTIVPWTSLWLYYYELWLIDGKWRGGGIHPDGRRDPELGRAS